MSVIRISSTTKRYSTPSQLVGKAGITFKEEQTRAICNVYIRWQPGENVVAIV